MVNPDAGSVSIVDPSLKQAAEVTVGGEPWSIAIAPDGATAYALDRAGGRLVPIDAATRAVGAPIRVGPEPGAVVVSPSGARAYVSVTAADQVAVIDTRSATVTARIPVEPRPYALAVTTVDGGSDRLIVTHFQALPRPGGAEATDDGREGRVSLLDLGSRTVTASIALPPDARGFPNLLAGASVIGQRAWIPHTRAAPDLPNGFKTTVFAAVAAVDLAAGRADPAEVIPLNDEDVFGSAVNDPVAAVPAPDGSRLYVVAAGSDVVEVVDVRAPRQPALIRFLPAGRNPRGLALSPDGRRGYVMSYLARSVTVLDLDKLELIAEVPVTRETLDPAVLRGKVLFNNGVDPRLTQRGWISCASCHPDGGTDGVTWRFPDGPRQTPALWNAAGTLPWHWSAALDEPQDVEDTITTIQHGLGLAPGADPPLLGRPLAGKSADLDALAIYTNSFEPRPSPHAPGGKLTPEAERGKSLFFSDAVGCAKCHTGPYFTDSSLKKPYNLHDVGTGDDPREKMGPKFDTPTLVSLYRTGPYLHDGRAKTLRDVLTTCNKDDKHGKTSHLKPAEIDELVAFLKSLPYEPLPDETPNTVRFRVKRK